MAKFKTDSPSLLRFCILCYSDSPGVDIEGLEVARECLIEAFHLHLNTTTNVKPGVLSDLFRSVRMKRSNHAASRTT
ncbi:Tetratricopeptide repeat (TPR)-like superfamily protein [Euphorbia peplus]|nr:Tetratricopeptide repeat (TPR)-like superfamily protein [Euphorbia peplus]